MPRIPYNPTRQPVRPQAQGRVNLSGAMNAVGREAASQGEVVRMFQGAAGTGLDIAKDIQERKFQEETAADRDRFENRATEAERAFNAAVNGIEVKDGVDFQAELQELRKNFVGELSDWIGEPGNVRHKQTHRAFQEQISMIDKSADELVYERANEYEQARNIGAGKTGRDIGIELNDHEKIRRSIQILHQEKAPGYVSEDEANQEYKDAVLKAEKLWDEQEVKAARTALKATGDREAFKKAVQQTKTLTKADKGDMIQQGIGSFAYNQLSEQYQVARNSESSLKELQDKIQSDPDLGVNQRSKLNGDVLAGMSELEAKMLANGQKAIADSVTEDFDFEDFLVRAEDTDSARGFRADEVELIKSTVSENRNTVKARQDFQRDQEDPEYKTLLNEILLETYLPNSNGNPDITKANRPELNEAQQAKYKEFRERISGGSFGVVAKAKLLDLYLTAKIQSVRAGEEGSGWKDGLWHRTYSETEQSFRTQVHRDYKRALENYGAWTGFAEHVATDDEALRDFFESNPNPTPSELQAKRSELKLTVQQKALREKVRRESAPQPAAGLSPKDQAARDWAIENPQDPRADAIRKTLELKGISL